MDKKERVARIQSGYIAFENLIQSIEGKYVPEWKLRNYYTITHNYEKSYGSVSIYFKADNPLPANIKDEVFNAFIESFPYPLAAGS